jgi:hypothetical protein
MMGNGADKEKQRRLEQQQAEDRARQLALMTTASQPTELETAASKEKLDWLNATSGKSGPIDVTKLPGMGASWGLYDQASKRKSGERMGIGALRLGAQGSDPNLTNLLEQQSNDQRQQDASGAFENAYRYKDAEMRGSIMPLLNLSQNRTMGLASLGSNNANASTSAWSNFRPAPSIWQQMLLSGISGGSNVASAYVGKP